MLTRRIIFLCTVSLCALLSLGAESPQTYVVTASRESEEILDVPAVIQVVTAGDISASGKTSLTGILEDCAGVTFRSYSTDARAQISLRGFGDNSFGRVAVLVDGKSLNNPDMAGINWLSIPVSSIERIEILDGPAGVTHGDGAIGGVVNIVTKDAPKGVSAGADLSYGSFNSKRALVSAGYGAERAGFLLSADILKTDGERDRSGMDATNVSLNGFFDVGDRLTLKPGLTWTDVAFKLPGGLSEAKFDDDPEAAAYEDDGGRETGWGASLLAAFDYDSWFTLDLPVDFQNLERKADISTSWGTNYYAYEQRQFAARPKARLDTGVAGLPLRLMAGCDYEGSIYEATQYAGEEREAKTSEYDFFQTSLSPWLTARVSLPFDAAAEAGIRYQYNLLEASDDLADEDWDKTDGAFAWDTALSWRPAEGLSLHAKVNTVYRIPFIDEVLTYGTFLDGLECETGWNAEVGIKYLPSEALSVQAVVYHLLMDGEIAYNMNTMRNENLDRTRRIGGTVDASFRPARFISLDAGAGYVYATFDNGSHEGDLIPLVPALTANAGATVFLPHGLVLGMDGSWTGESKDPGYLDYPDSYGTIDSFFLLGARLGFTPPALGKKLSFNARADNILDASYAPLVYWGLHYPAPGRSFTLNVAYRY